MNAAPLKVLAVDDNEEGLFALEQLLLAEGYQVATARGGKEALSAMERDIPDVALLDINMPAPDGLELTRYMRSQKLLSFVVIMLLTARGDLDEVVQGLEAGADDYVRKPYERSELLARLRANVRRVRLNREYVRAVSRSSELENELRERSGYGAMLGTSAPMQDVYSLIERIKDADVPVLITGESGTGKELVASALHSHSPRSGQPFIVQNCSAFNENLLESELFGHVRGAFTGAVRDKEGLFSAADGGTFFLDELGEMSAALQVKLLRVLQDGTFTPVGSTVQKRVNVRIIAATNRDLKSMIASGSFREDLYYRLNVVNIHLPPLRERRSDIPQLCEHFVERFCKKNSRAPKRLTAEALRFLSGYAWPGNIRELQNEIERVVLLSGQDELITPAVLSAHIQGVAGAGAVAAPPGKLKDALEALERSMITAALERSGNNKSEAARELGVSRSNLIAKAQSYGLE